MAEALKLSQTLDRKQLYDELIPQLRSLVAEEEDLTANLANIVAALKEVFGFFWVGFYLKKGNHLVLAPFQGPIACTRIELDKGVCGYAYMNKRIVVVPNVDEFPGHIACSSLSKSEIVVPIFDSEGEVFGVLDVDSDKPNDFSAADEEGLRKVASIVEKLISR